jgi:hypothetical protein
MQEPGSEVRPDSEPSCNVSSTLNFTIGAVAIVAAVAIGWLILRMVR